MSEQRRPAPSVEKLYSTAMSVERQGDNASRDGAMRAARRNYGTAAQLLEQALVTIFSSTTAVDKGVLVSNAARLYLLAGDYRKAVEMAKRGLSETEGMVAYTATREELQVVLEEARSHLLISRVKKIVHSRRKRG